MTKAGMGYAVQLNPSGRDFVVEAHESVLDAALRSGVALPYGCRNGSCGSCKGRLIGGEVDYPHGQPSGLSEGDQERGLTYLCQAHPRNDLQIEIHEIDAAMGLTVRTLPCRVAKKERLAHDVIALYLKLPETERLQFIAGQYVDILMRNGRRRAFSLANAPHDDEFLVLHIRHVPDGEFSDYVFTVLKERSLLRIHGPLGGFFLRESERPIIFVAGGTGFSPINSIIESALAEGITRPMHLYCGVRARRDLYMDALVSNWTHSDCDLSYTPVLSEPAAEDDWSGRTGFVHEAVLEDFPDLEGVEVYASGPPVMVNAVWDAFPEHGLDPDHIFSDSFEFAYETGHNG